MNATDETRIADEIVRVLPEGSVVRVCSDDRESIRYAVRDASLKLHSIVLRRSSLRKLINDPARNVKVEYLGRELSQAATQRSEYRYPRPIRLHSRVTMPVRVRMLAVGGIF
jgi:hypothetical protein